LLAAPLAVVVLGIAPGREIPTEAHRDRPCGNLRETRRDDGRRGLNGPDRPAASANGTVRPSDMPMTMSRTVSPDVKWRDELEGKAEGLKGKIKQAAGTLTGDPDLHDEGVIDEVAGKTQAAVGRTKRKVGEAIEHVGNVIKK
jgi:uncharacterized protein YjbJ (UPF0337 family)